jgi:rRNA biogenesis protein RRP5
MQVLPEKKQIDITIYYAQLLFTYDNIEEGRYTFDNIVKEYPKRKDIWFVYIDKEIKYGKNVEKNRKLFERMFNIPFKLSALKSIFKKYSEYEQTNGEKTLENLKNKIQEIMKF